MVVSYKTIIAMKSSWVWIMETVNFSSLVIFDIEDIDISRIWMFTSLLPFIFYTFFGIMPKIPMKKKYILFGFLFVFFCVGWRYLWIRFLDRDMLHLLYVIATEHDEPDIAPLEKISYFLAKSSLYQKYTQNSNLIKLLKDPKSLAYFSSPLAYREQDLDNLPLEIETLEVSLLPRLWLHEYKICYNGSYRIWARNQAIKEIKVCYPIILSGDIIQLDKNVFYGTNNL